MPNNCRPHNITHEEVNHWFRLWGILGKRHHAEADDILSNQQGRVKNVNLSFFQNETDIKPSHSHFRSCF